MAKQRSAVIPSIFINCPFTQDYTVLFRAIIFTVLTCGFRPRSALEAGDAGDIRLDKIVRLIRESSYSIHDLSAVELDPINNLPRFNMPFELGLVLGSKKLGGAKYSRRPILILEKNKYTYQKCLSDIAGQDLRSHNGSPEEVITAVRNWLRQEAQGKSIPGQKTISAAFHKFSLQFPDICRMAGLEHEDVSFIDYVSIAMDWQIEENAVAAI
jgi:hypothetical protein